jgi:hypothetical protein
MRPKFEWPSCSGRGRGRTSIFGEFYVDANNSLDRLESLPRWLRQKQIKSQGLDRHVKESGTKETLACKVRKACEGSHHVAWQQADTIRCHNLQREHPFIQVVEDVFDIVGPEHLASGQRAAAAAIPRPGAVRARRNRVGVSILAPSLAPLYTRSNHLDELGRIACKVGAIYVDVDGDSVRDPAGLPPTKLQSVCVETTTHAPCLYCNPYNTENPRCYHTGLRQTFPALILQGGVSRQTLFLSKKTVTNLLPRHPAENQIDTAFLVNGKQCNRNTTQGKQLVSCVLQACHIHLSQSDRFARKARDSSTRAASRSVVTRK